MILQKVKLAKLATDNGMFHVVEGVELGKEYWMQPNTIRTATFKSLKTGKIHKADVVNDETGAYFPIELLEFVDEFASKEHHG